MDGNRAWQLVIVLMVALGMGIAHASSYYRQQQEDRLATALEQADYTKAQTLLQRGADLGIRDSDGNTLLMLAAWSGDVSFTRELLDRGAAVNARNNEGSTALMWAAQFGRTKIVKLLLDRGADRKARGKYGYDALMTARMLGREGVVKLLTDERPCAASGASPFGNPRAAKGEHASRRLAKSRRSSR